MALRRRRGAGLVAAAALLVATAPPLLAQPAITVERNYYTVSGTTPRELRRDMGRKGPKGFWAYTRWRVRWSRDCKVSLQVTYTFPQLERREALPLPLRRKWDAMLRRLAQHEEQHAAHGLAAAREVEAARCKDARAIVARWSRRTKQLDIDTDHGRSQGVVLPD